MVNEEILMNSLKNQGFVVLDGSESLEEQIFYFTNASIIVGVHSSLMKNMVWCKKNPIFVDLCPATRANFDMNGNALSLGFTTVIIVLENNKLEEISISEEKMSMLSKFISLLTKSLD
jgi:capsular polysaccharide biosynthesis protein